MYWIRRSIILFIVFLAWIVLHLLSYWRSLSPQVLDSGILYQDWFFCALIFISGRWCMNLASFSILIFGVLLIILRERHNPRLRSLLSGCLYLNLSVLIAKLALFVFTFTFGDPNADPPVIPKPFILPYHVLGQDVIIQTVLANTTAHTLSFLVTTSALPADHPLAAYNLTTAYAIAAPHIFAAGHNLAPATTDHTLTRHHSSVNAPQLTPECALAHTLTHARKAVRAVHPPNTKIARAFIPTSPYTVESLVTLSVATSAAYLKTSFKTALTTAYSTRKLIKKIKQTHHQPSSLPSWIA